MLSEKELTVLARIGSGSSCRSIPDGIVKWKFGRKNEDSYAYSIYPQDYWDICDIIAVVGTGEKEISSTEGHAIAESSPFYKTRILGMEKKIKELEAALRNKDFAKFGEVVEAEAVNMHAVMMTSKPPLYYWNPNTMKIMNAVLNLRKKAIECYFTIDAGPNVHVICETKNADKIEKYLLKTDGVKDLIKNASCKGAHLVR